MELNDCYSLQPDPVREHGDSVLPARLRVGVPGQLGSRLFGIQRSAGPESSQQTQVGAATCLTAVLGAKMFCFKMFRWDVVP